MRRGHTMTTAGSENTGVIASSLSLCTFDMLQSSVHRRHFCGTAISFLHRTTKRLCSPSSLCFSCWRPPTQKRTSAISPLWCLSHGQIVVAPGHRLVAAPQSLPHIKIYSFHNSANPFELPERRQRGTPSKQVALNREIIALGKRRKWKEILQLYNKEKKNYDHVNYATTLSQLGRIRLVDTSHFLFESFVFDLADKLDERGIKWMGLQGAGNIAHAIAKMQLKSSAAQMIIEFIAGINAKTVVSEGKPQEIANIAWALGKLECSDVAPAYFDEVEKRVAWLVQEGRPQAVSNTAWACGSLGIHSPKLFAAIDKHADWLVQDGKPQEVANSAWACGTLGIKCPNLFSAIEERSDWLVQSGEPQNISNTAWACGTLGVQSPRLFASIESKAEWLVQEGNPQAIANAAWACGTLSIQSPKLFAYIEKRAHFLVHTGNTQDVANTLWTFGKLQYHAPAFLKEADARGSWIVKMGNPQNIANSALAFAQLGFAPKTFLRALASNVEKLALEGNEQEICNICYAICILDQCHSKMLPYLWDKALCLSPSRLSFEHMSQLAQVYAMCEAAGMKLLDPPHEFFTLMKKIAQKSSSNISRSQREVSECLSGIGIEHTMEVSPFPEDSLFVGTSMLAVDMASKQHSLAIEFDGDSHFLRELGTGNVTRIENGMTQAKRRFLQRLGWKVVNIHYLDWIEASSKGSQESFLRKGCIVN